MWKPCIDSVWLMACRFIVFLFSKQKTAYEVRISDWSSDVCSSDLARLCEVRRVPAPSRRSERPAPASRKLDALHADPVGERCWIWRPHLAQPVAPGRGDPGAVARPRPQRPVRLHRPPGPIYHRLDVAARDEREIGRAQVRTPVHNTQLQV